MLIEYDLVIIGATELGCRMALRARQLGARVALVEQGEQPETTIAWRHWLACDSTKLGSELAAQLDAIAIADECKPLTPEALQIQGVDYLAATGTWIEQPKAGLQVGDRLLRSSSYVAALTPNRPQADPPTGLSVGTRLTGAVAAPIRCAPSLGFLSTD